MPNYEQVLPVAPTSRPRWPQVGQEALGQEAALLDESPAVRQLFRVAVQHCLRRLC